MKYLFFIVFFFVSVVNGFTQPKSNEVEIEMSLCQKLGLTSHGVFLYEKCTVRCYNDTDTCYHIYAVYPKTTLDSVYMATPDFSNHAIGRIDQEEQEQEHHYKVPLIKLEKKLFTECE